MTQAETFVKRHHPVAHCVRDGEWFVVLEDLNGRELARSHDGTYWAWENAAVVVAGELGGGKGGVIIP